jgi:predicted amidohydrolase YtcJ
MNSSYRIVLAATLFAAASAQTGPFADLVLRGGKVITVDGQDRIGGAVALTGNRITSVGSNSDIARLIGPQTQVIELNGRTLLPGFIDSHSHVQGLAESEHAMVPIQAPPLKGAADIIAKLRGRRRLRRARGSSVKARITKSCRRARTWIEIFRIIPWFCAGARMICC